MKCVLPSSSIFDLSQDCLWSVEQNKKRDFHLLVEAVPSAKDGKGNFLGTGVNHCKRSIRLAALEGAPVLLPSHSVNNQKFAHLLWPLPFSVFNIVTSGNAM